MSVTPPTPTPRKHPRMPSSRAPSADFTCAMKGPQKTSENSLPSASIGCAIRPAMPTSTPPRTHLTPLHRPPWCARAKPRSKRQSFDKEWPAHHEELGLETALEALLRPQNSSYFRPYAREFLLCALPRLSMPRHEESPLPVPEAHNSSLKKKHFEPGALGSPGEPWGALSPRLSRSVLDRQRGSHKWAKQSTQILGSFSDSNLGCA